MLFADDLARQYASKTELVANSLHPGIVTTDLVRYISPAFMLSKTGGLPKIVSDQLSKIGVRSADEGCKTSVWLANSIDAIENSGTFFVDPGVVYPGASKKQLAESGNWFLVSGEEFLAPQLGYPEKLFEWRNVSNASLLREKSYDYVIDYML